MASEFEIQGLDAVLAKLRTLAPKLQKKGLRSAGTKAMRIVRDAARSGAKAWDDPATNAKPIWKRIVTRYDARGSKREGGVVVKVGVEGGAKLSKDPENAGHWRLNELGSENNAARPAMRPALANNVQAVTDAFVAAASAEIDKIIAKGV